IHLVPQNERRLRQKPIMEEVRRELEQIHDIRVVVRDQSTTEGFTALQGFPVDFAIQGDWRKLPEHARAIKERLEQSGAVQDIDSDFRPGMPELRILPDREKLALVKTPVSRVADTINLYVGSPRVAKFTAGGRRYDVRVRLVLEQRSSPNNLDWI